MTSSLVLLGTDHRSDDSSDIVRETISRVEPEVVAVELCGRRYDGAVSGFDSYTYDRSREPRLLTVISVALVNRIQSKDEVVETDMESAISSAAELGCEVALVDRDIYKTFDIYWDNVKPREMATFFSELLLSIGSQYLPSFLSDIVQENRVLFYNEPSRESQVERYVKEIGEKMPAFKQVFIDSRDKEMASRIESIASDKDSLIAVIGAAHEPGVSEWLGSVPETGGVTLLEPSQYLER